MTKSLAIVAATGIACFLAGRSSVAVHGAAFSTANDGGKAGGDVPERRMRVARDRQADVGGAATLPDEVKISVPKKKVEEMLGKNLGGVEFHQLDGPLRQSLRLLGANEEETKVVLEAATRMRDDIFKEETRGAVVKEHSSSKLVVDLSGMKEPMLEIRGRMEAELRGALPSESAEMLMDGLHWKRLYPEDQFDITFSIKRDPKSGRLVPVVMHQGYNDNLGIVPPTYPDDGTPIPADKVFRYRWAVLLAGKTLVPVDEPGK